MGNLFQYYQSPIGKKQIVAATGLFLIVYVVVHLAGNLLIFAGPQVFNAYAEKLAKLRPGLYLIEGLLLWAFLVHMFVTAVLVWENVQSRGSSYALYKPRNRSLSAKLMPYTGGVILIFVIWHLWDFTFVDKTGPRTLLSDGKSYGLYGIVFNSFIDLRHSFLYIVCMFCVGLHLSHGVQSFAQTFGLVDENKLKALKVFSEIFGLLIAFSYSSIPAYVYWFYLKII